MCNFCRHAFLASFANLKYRTVFMDTTALARGSQQCVAHQKQPNIDVAKLKNDEPPFWHYCCFAHFLVCENVTKNVACKNVAYKNALCHIFYLLKNNCFAWSISPNSPCGRTFCTPYDTRYAVCG